MRRAQPRLANLLLSRSGLEELLQILYHVSRMLAMRIGWVQPLARAKPGPRLPPLAAASEGQPHAAKQPLTTSVTASSTPKPSARSSLNLVGMLSSVSLASGESVLAREGGRIGVRVGGVDGAVGESEGSE